MDQPQPASGEWWVVLDSCVHPDSGLLAELLVGLGVGVLDISDFVVRRRAAWSSVHDLGDCTWCGTP